MNNMDFLCHLPFPHVCKKILSYFFHTVLSYTFLLGNEIKKDRYATFYRISVFYM